MVHWGLEGERPTEDSAFDLTSILHTTNLLFNVSDDNLSENLGKRVAWSNTFASIINTTHVYDTPERLIGSSSRQRQRELENADHVVYDPLSTILDHHLVEFAESLCGGEDCDPDIFDNQGNLKKFIGDWQAEFLKGRETHTSMGTGTGTGAKTRRLTTSCDFQPSPPSDTPSDTPSSAASRNEPLLNNFFVIVVGVVVIVAFLICSCSCVMGNKMKKTKERAKERGRERGGVCL